MVRVRLDLRVYLHLRAELAKALLSLLVHHGRHLLVFHRTDNHSLSFSYLH